MIAAPGIGGDIGAFLKGLVGGEVKQCTRMVEDVRKQALDRLVRNAREMRANAVVMMRLGERRYVPGDAG